MLPEHGPGNGQRSESISASLGARQVALFGFVLALAIAMVTPVRSEEDPQKKILIHGFGGWAYAETDGNRYLLGDREGNYDTAELSLNVTASPFERLTIVAQVHLERDREEEEVELDYGFVEWEFSDAARLRFGRVKHPYGLYGEIFDLGTVRPFYLLPQGIYGEVGTTSKNYNGIGLKGTRFLGTWELQYDAFFGELQNTVEVQGAISVNPEEFFDPTISFPSVVEDAIGGRINIVSPVNGLSFGLSGYRGDQGIDDLLEAIGASGDRTNFGMHVEYSSRPWLFRGEYADLKIGNTVNFDSYYAELAYYVTDHWQIAARFDRFINKIPGVEFFPPWVQQVAMSDDIGFALNYWFRPEFVLRLNYHIVDGNRFAWPDQPGDIENAIFFNILDTETEMLLVGVHFSF